MTGRWTTPRCENQALADTMIRIAPFKTGSADLEGTVIRNSRCVPRRGEKEVSLGGISCLKGPAFGKRKAIRKD